MKNLIKEIEKRFGMAKDNYCCCLDEEKYDLANDYYELAGLCQSCLKVLTQHNIITAPKQIKLSELIDKIYDTKYSSECYVKAIKCSSGQYKDDYHYRIHIEYGEGYWGDYEFYIVDGKISSAFDMNLPRDEFKWLYTLWIAGTEIVDDLKEYDE